MPSTVDLENFASGLFHTDSFTLVRSNGEHVCMPILRVFYAHHFEKKEVARYILTCTACRKSPGSAHEENRGDVAVWLRGEVFAHCTACHT